MSAYDDAGRTIQKCDQLIRDFESQVTTAQRDKTGLRWMSSEKGMTLTTDMHEGHYGCSSVYDRGSPEAAALLAEVLNRLKPQIIEKAVELLKKRKKVAAEEAAQEAKRILAELAPPKEETPDA